MRKRLTNKTLYGSIYDQSIEADLITFGGKAYPTDGQVLLVAGGAGSGKGTIIRSLIGMQGKVLDVDSWKEMATNTNNPKVMDIMRRLLERKLGKDRMPDLDKLNLANPEDVSVLHKLMKDAGIEDMMDRMLRPIKYMKNKPNLIFDKTFRNMFNIQEVVAQVLGLGYKNENIHMVCVMNDVYLAVENNRGRERCVGEDILRATHAGVSQTMRGLFAMGDKLDSVVGGDIWICFNKTGVDVKLDRLPVRERSVAVGLRSYDQTFYIEKSHCVKVKEKGKNVDLSRFEKKLSDEISQTVLQKIAEYTHDSSWLKK